MFVFMKLTLAENKLNIHPEQFMRERCGYAFLRSKNTGKESYVYRLTRDFYPRFHLYIERKNGNVTFDLHLDQKEASYQGSRAHNGEYDGPAVENELKRIKSLLIKEITDNQPLANSKNDEVEQDIDEFAKVGHGTYKKNLKKEKKGFFAKLFG